MCSHCDWQEALDTYDELLGDCDYKFASDTLQGIRDWIEDNQHITDRQSDAIENIRNSK